VENRRETGMKRIMALIDFSDVTPAVVRIARDMARAFNCEMIWA